MHYPVSFTTAFYFSFPDLLWTKQKVGEDFAPKSFGNEIILYSEERRKLQLFEIWFSLFVFLFTFTFLLFLIISFAISKSCMCMKIIAWFCFLLSSMSRTAYVDISGYLDQPHVALCWPVNRLHNYQPLRAEPYVSAEKDWYLLKNPAAVQFLPGDGLDWGQQSSCTRRGNRK